MRTTATGKSILENTMEIIQKMEEATIDGFQKASLDDRKQPAYLKLFQYLNRKIQGGAVAENFDENALKKWIKENGWSQDDLIANLYEKLLAFVGNEFSKKGVEQWMKRVNQSLDQAEGLIDMRLLEQAKAILNKLDTEFKTRMPEYDYKWDFAVARFIFVRWRWKHLFTEKALPWMEEIASLVQSMSFSHSSHSRPYVPSPNTSPQTREQWSGSAILLQLRWLHAKHFAEYRAQLDALQEMVSQPVLRNYRNARIEETPSQQGQADKEGYSEPLTAVEQFFLRLNIIEFAASHGDLHTVQSYLGEPYEIPPAKVLYPACNLWSAYQFYQGRMAYMFQGKQLVEDRGNGFSLDDFLEFWKMTTAEAIEGLPLRMEIHQILILCGSGQFSKALQRIKELLKVRENKANPDLRMLEILSIYQCGKEAYEPAYPLLTMANKKAKDNPEWQFVKCFAICLSVTLPVAIFIGPNGRWLLLTADQIRESQSTFG